MSQEHSPATLGGTPSREEVAHDIGYRVLWAANFGSFTDLRKVAREAADFLHSKPEPAPLEDCEPYMREPYKSALSAPSARGEYICKCGVRVAPHRCSTGTEF